MDLNDRENIAPYIRGARDGGDPPNIVHLLNNRQLGLTRRRSPTDFKQFAELKASRSQLQETHCNLPESARSTFLMSFSHDCTKIASTHGDHNIYVSEMKTGRPIKTLEGHPRTPWCIAFHPTSNDILASGCLAGEVRVWDLRGGGSERWRAEHDRVIASLAFHPTDQLLVIATGNSLYFWNWSNPAPDGHCSTNSDLEKVRYVKFDPLGFRIITGIENVNNCFGHHNNTCGLTSTSRRTHPTYFRQNPRDIDIYRACRRSVMERLINLPEPETLRRQPCTTSSSRTDRNVASSSSFTKVTKSRVDTSSVDNNAGTSGAGTSGAGTSGAGTSGTGTSGAGTSGTGTSGTGTSGAGTSGAGTSDETNRSRLSRVDDESRPHRDIRPSAGSASDRSPEVVRRSGPYPDIFAESYFGDLARVLNGCVVLREFGPLLFDTPTTSSTELQQTVRTSPEDDLDTDSSISSRPAEWSQSLVIDRRGNLRLRNNLETSTDHQNNSLSDHDYFSESNMPQSRVNNESVNNSEPSFSARQIKEDSNHLQRTVHSLRGLCDDLEQQLSRAVSLSQINEISEPRADPFQNNRGRRVLQSNETTEPRAGPSQISRGRRVLQSNETSEPKAGPSQSNETSEPRAGPSQNDHESRVLQSNKACGPGAGLPQNDGRNQISNLADLAPRSEDGDSEHRNRYAEMSGVSLSLQINNQRLRQRVWNIVATTRVSDSTEQIRTDTNTSSSQISVSLQLSPQPSVTTQNLSLLTSSVPEEMCADSYNNTEHSAEMRNTLRNPLRALRDNVERPTVDENKTDINSESSPSHTNPLNYVKRSRSSHLETNEEISRSKKQKRNQFDETARGSLNDGPSTAQTSDNPQSPVIPHLSSVKVSFDKSTSHLTIHICPSPTAMDISSSSVTTETSSALINTEDSTTFTRHSPQSRTIDLIDITDENLPAISREETDNHKIDSLRAEASTQASSPSDSRNSPDLIDITDEDLPAISREETDNYEIDILRAEASTQASSPSDSRNSPDLIDITDEDLPAISREETHNHEIDKLRAEASTQASSSSDSRNSPDLIDITDEDLPAISREETDNHEINKLRAEANTQASSPSDSRNYSQQAFTIEDMSDDDDDTFPSVLSNKRQCSAGCISIAGPKSLTPTKPYREETDNHEIDTRAEASTQASSPSDSRNYSQLAITIEDMSDDDDETFPSVLSNKRELSAGCIPIDGPSTSLTPTKPYRQFQIEDISDTEIEFEILQPQGPIASNPIQIEDISDSDLELETPQTEGPVVFAPSTPDLGVLNESGSRSGHSRELSSFIDRILEPISDASSDDSDRPSTPPLLMYSQAYNSLLFTGNPQITLNDPLTQNHRIQVWDFTSGEFPPIYDATANIVVRRCMIHNDASVDISQDGEKLVALIRPEERDLNYNLMFGVFSLRPGQIGRTLCIWGYISNPISVSFSPLAQYVVVGSAYSRPIYSNPEKAAVAQIIKINKSRDSYDARYIRSFTQVINNDNRFQQVSLNCVRWLPISGLGIAYATNRGCLCICRPVAGEMFENVPNEPATENDRMGQRIFQQIQAFYRPRQ